MAVCDRETGALFCLAEQQEDIPGVHIPDSRPSSEGVSSAPPFFPAGSSARWEIGALFAILTSIAVSVWSIRTTVEAIRIPCGTELHTD